MANTVDELAGELVESVYTQEVYRSLGATGLVDESTGSIYDAGV